MNLYSRPGSHRLVILADSARALSASRNSSTNRMRRLLNDLGVAQRRDLVVVGLTDALEELHRGPRLRFVDLGQREPDVDEHPVAGLDALLGHQPDVDGPLDAADVDLGQVRPVGEDLDHFSWNAEAHVSSSCAASRLIRSRTAVTAVPTAAATGSDRRIPSSRQAGSQPTSSTRPASAPSTPTRPITTSGCMPCASSSGGCSPGSTGSSSMTY